MNTGEIKADVKRGFSLSFIITFLVAFMLANLILSALDMFPYTNVVSAFIRNPIAVLKAKFGAPAAGS